MKRIITILLAFVLTITLVACGTKDEPTVEKTTFANDYLIENGILVKYNGSYENVVIPDSVTEIGSNAFSGCTQIASVTIPDGVLEICRSAFSNCVKLTNITIPGSVLEIGEGAFENCTSLTTLAFENNKYGIGRISVGAEAFKGCAGLTSVQFSNSATLIGVSAFENCTALESINIPKNVMLIGSRAFGYYRDGYDENFNIYGVHNYVAEEYAKENNIKFVEVEDSYNAVADANERGYGLTSLTVRKGTDNSTELPFALNPTELPIILIGFDIDAISAEYDSANKTYSVVLETFNEYVKDILTDNTGSYTNTNGECLSIWIDNTCVIVLPLPHQITDGKLVCAGNYSKDEADKLVAELTLASRGLGLTN